MSSTSTERAGALGFSGAGRWVLRGSHHLPRRPRLLLHRRRGARAPGIEGEAGHRRRRPESREGPRCRYGGLVRGTCSGREGGHADLPRVEEAPGRGVRAPQLRVVRDGPRGGGEHPRGARPAPPRRPASPPGGGAPGAGGGAAPTRGWGGGPGGGGKTVRGGSPPPPGPRPVHL